MKRILSIALAALMTAALMTSVSAVDQKGKNNDTVTAEVSGVSTEAPVIDGKIGKYEYSEIDYTADDMYYSGPTDARLKVTLGLGCKLYASYDADYMYVAVVLDTPEFIQEADPASNMWQQHCLQISAAKGNETEAATRTEIGISRNTKTNEQISNVWVDAYGTSVALEGGKDFMVVTENGVTTYEARIPAACFGVKSLKEGEQVRMNFCINAGSASDDRGVIEWASGCCSGKDATKHALVDLTEAIEIPVAAAPTADFASMTVIALAISAAAAIVISKKH